MLGNLAEIKVVQEFALVSILIIVVWTLLGTDAIRAFALPLLFLFFAVPFGTSLIKPLQNFTAWFVIHALTISNVAAVMEGHTISLPSGVWAVAEACSGIRFLMSSVVVGTFFSFLIYRSLWRRLAFVAASIVIPIIGNGLRAYGTIMLAYFTNGKLAAGVDHIVYGWLFAVFLEAVLMIVGLRWRESSEPGTRLTSSLPLNTRNNDFPGNAVVFAAAAASVVIIIVPFVAKYFWNQGSPTAEWPDPPVIVSSPWQVVAENDMGWSTEWHGPHREFKRNYEYQKAQVGLDLVGYSGREAMDPETPSDGLPSGKPWDLVGDGLGTAMLGGRRIEVYRSLMESPTASRSVWTWYCVNGECTSSRTKIRLLRAEARVLRKPAAVAIISVGVDNQTITSRPDQVLEEFLQHTSFLISSGPSMNTESSASQGGAVQSARLPGKSR
jgi:EpsI family protein